MKSSWLPLAVLVAAGSLLTGCETEQCSPTNCGGCCDSNNQCVTQETQSTLACGAYGQACAPCALSQVCRNAVCQVPINMSGGGAGGTTGGGGGSSDAGLPLIVGCWNIEWFADPPQADGGYLGPRDNQLQQDNVLTALRARP